MAIGLKETFNMENTSSIQVNSSFETTYKDPDIRRYGVGFINVYEITDGDLEIIERGSNNLIYLNFSISLISIAISFLIALVTCDFKSIITQNIFIIVTIIGFLGGLFFTIMWVKTKDDVKATIKKIKDRSRLS